MKSYTKLPETYKSIPSPAEIYCEKMRVIKFQAESLIKSMPVPVHKPLKLFSSACEILFLQVQQEEHLRPEFSFDVRLYNKKESMLKQFAEETKKYEEALLAYNAKLHILEVKLQEVQHEIIEKQEGIKSQKMENQENHEKSLLEKETEIMELTHFIAKQHWILRYFFPCFLSKEVKVAKIKLKRLKESSVRPKINKCILFEDELAILEKQKLALQNEQLDLLKLHPRLENKVADLPRSIDNLIDQEEYRYYTSVSRNTMFHMLRVYELYSLFLSKLEAHLSVQILESQSIKTLKNFYQTCLSSKASIKEKLMDFWCPESNNNNWLFFYDNFRRLKALDREKILLDEDATLMDQLIPSIRFITDFNKTVNPNLHNKNGHVR